MRQIWVWSLKSGVSRFQGSEKFGIMNVLMVVDCSYCIYFSFTMLVCDDFDRNLVTSELRNLKLHNSRQVDYLEGTARGVRSGPLESKYWGRKYQFPLEILRAKKSTMRKLEWANQWRYRKIAKNKWGNVRAVLKTSIKVVDRNKNSIEQVLLYL